MKLYIDNAQLDRIIKDYAASKGFRLTDGAHVGWPDEPGEGCTVFGLEDEPEPSGQVEDFAYTGS